VNSFTTLVKRIPLRRILSAVFAGLILAFGTAYNGVTAVQVGNADNYNSQVLIAINDESELLYPGAETPVGRAYKEAELPIKTEKDFQPKSGGLIQREENLGTRFQERIDTVKEAVGEASGFLKDKADEASQRPELMKNPAVNK